MMCIETFVALIVREMVQKNVTLLFHIVDKVFMALV